MPFDQVQHGRGLRNGFLGCDDDGGAGEQGVVELEGGDVEGDGGDREQPVLRPDRSLLPHAHEEVEQGAVRDHHTLGPSGRARGVDDVRGVLRKEWGDPAVVGRIAVEGGVQGLPYGVGIEDQPLCGAHLRDHPVRRRGREQQ
ncbi:hypothetical protein H0E86_03305 [Streptomyces sp. SCSIO-PteL053]|nr:hypothetical protein H0E86_03305 [Streptomyces sp. SCSIO-PteL053]